jgi:hypothetical protein
MPDVNMLMQKQTENFKFGNCIGERIFSTFGYSSNAGFILNKKFNGIIHQHGTDGTLNGIRIFDNAKALFVNTLIAPVTPMILYSGSNVKLLHPEEAAAVKKIPTAIYTDSSFTGDVNFVNSSTWGYGQSLQLNGIGKININQITSMLAQSVITNPNTHISSAYSFFGHDLNWQAGTKPSPASVFGLAANSSTDFKGAVISFGARVTASSKVSDGQGPQCAVDGTSASLFASINKSPTWVEIDLGKTFNVTGIEIMHTGKKNDARFNTKNFIISGRKDSSQEWQAINSRTNNSDFVTTHHVKDEYRFIKIDISKPNSTLEDNHTRFKEVMVYGY